MLGRLADAPDPRAAGASPTKQRAGAGRQGSRSRRRFVTIAAGLAGLAALTLGGCERGSGYVEIRVVPSNMRAPRLLLDSTRLDPIRDGQTILTARTGTHPLQMEWIGGQNTVLCEIEVRKDRITTVTVSVLSRPPRCQCRRSGSDTKRRVRLCVS